MCTGTLSIDNITYTINNTLIQMFLQVLKNLTQIIHVLYATLITKACTFQYL